LIDLTDEIGYNTADLDDGYEARLLTIEQISSCVNIFDRCYRDAQTLYPKAVEKLLFNEALKRVFDSLVGDLISSTRQRLEQAGMRSLDAIRRHPERLAPSARPSPKSVASSKTSSMRISISAPLWLEKKKTPSHHRRTLCHWMEEPDDLPAPTARNPPTSPCLASSATTSPA